MPTRSASWPRTARDCGSGSTAADFLSRKREARAAGVCRRRGERGMSGRGRRRCWRRLMAQAEGRGVDLVTLRALVEESSQAGARRALGALGLDDERARRDMDELRELLAAWRDAKRSAWQAVVSWVVRVLCAGAVLIGLAVRLTADAMCGDAVRACALRDMRRCSTGRTGAGMWCGAGRFARRWRRAREVPLLWQHKAGAGDRAGRAFGRGQARAAGDRASSADGRMRRGWWLRAGSSTG